jgi:NapC/NirT cytochrome c family protein
MGNLGAKFRQWLSPYVYLSSNWLSLMGVVVVTTAVVLWIYLLPILVRGEITHPYVGILIFMGLPSLFVGGLLLIPLGIYIRSRRERGKGIYPSNFPPLDFKNADLRRLMMFVLVATAVNVIIGGQLVYSSVNYMDSVTFCGRTCHTVMQPEFTAYSHSPHARVACVECHIGPGASWFVRSKLSGVHQVFAVTFNTFDRPIPTPVTSLRPARETCEACHWPARFEGNRLLVVPHYADDQANTLTKDVLLMHIGGGNGHQGIHGMHVGPGITIHYGSDENRQKINWVEYDDSQSGKRTLYVDPSVDPKTVDTSKGRVMDCIDCHNRPTHIFHMPEEAMDTAMANGSIPASLPFIKKEGVELLKVKYSSQAEAGRLISAQLEAYYLSNFPNVQKAEVEQASQAIVAIYDQNVFPQMKITWGTYPNNLGHMDFPGCFRCHGTLQSAADKNVQIPQDCDTCHALLAVGEANPKILEQLQMGDSASNTKNP